MHTGPKELHVPTLLRDGPGDCFRVTVSQDGLVDTSLLRSAAAWPLLLASTVAKLLAPLPMYADVVEFALAVYKEVGLRPWLRGFLEAFAWVVEERLLRQGEPTAHLRDEASLLGLLPQNAAGRRLRETKWVAALRESLGESVARKLLRYFWRCREMFSRSTQQCHMSVDASRLGNRNCMLVAVGSVVDGKGTCAWAPPQASRPHIT